MTRIGTALEAVVIADGHLPVGALHLLRTIVMPYRRILLQSKPCRRVVHEARRAVKGIQPLRCSGNARQFVLLVVTRSCFLLVLSLH